MCIRSYVCLSNTGCKNITRNCSRGTECRVDETVHQAYCEPSCDLDNGGCADNKVCSLQQQKNCTGGPCPPVVQCLGESSVQLPTNTSIKAEYIYVAIWYFS